MSKTILICIDTQNDFIDGLLGSEQAVDTVPNIVKKIEEFNNGIIITTQDTHETNYMETPEGKSLPVPHCIKGTKGHELFGKVKELANGYLLIEKETFGSKDLMKFLEGKEFQKIELIGVVTNICVISNAVIVKAMLPNTDIVVDASCSSSNDEVLERKALDILENLHIRVINK